MNEYKPDLLHCNAVRPALYGQAVAHKCRIPAIFHARIDQQDPADVLLIRRMHGIICSSEVVRKRFPDGRKRPVVKVIHNPIDLEEFRNPANAGELRSRWQQHRGDRLIGLPARLAPAKGHLEFLAAAPVVLQHCPETTFVFIGDEDQTAKGFREEIQRIVESKALTNHVTFAGFQTDMASAYAALDIVVFPSHSEGFGRIAIEAGASRRPLVANDLAVLREILPDNGAGYLVDCRDTESFARRLIRLLEDAAFRTQSVERLFDHIRNQFNLETHREQVVGAYNDVLKSVQ
jgi:glycosyltransferase involved in cell wall biosynthesis